MRNDPKAPSEARRDDSICADHSKFLLIGALVSYLVLVIFFGLSSLPEVLNEEDQLFYFFAAMVVQAGWTTVLVVAIWPFTRLRKLRSKSPWFNPLVLIVGGALGAGIAFLSGFYDWSLAVCGGLIGFSYEFQRCLWVKKNR